MNFVYGILAGWVILGLMWWLQSRLAERSGAIGYDELLVRHAKLLLDTKLYAEWLKLLNQLKSRCPKDAVLQMASVMAKGIVTVNGRLIQLPSKGAGYYLDNIAASYFAENAEFSIAEPETAEVPPT